MGTTVSNEPILLDEIDRALLDEFQQGMPLEPRPYARIAEALGVSEGSVLDRLRRLQELGAVSRVGAVLGAHQVGASTLAAMAVPGGRLAEVASLVSAYPEVNHNYEREHRFNLWFVVTAADSERVAAVLDDIRSRAALDVMELPLLEDYHINLGFRLRWI